MPPPDVEPQTKRRPADDEYAPFYAGYVARVPEADVVAVLAEQAELLRRLGATLSPDRELHAYAPGKWTIRELLGHLIDGERVFGFRAFCISRGEQTSLPGFDENRYVENSRFRDTPVRDLVHEFSLVREANLFFLRRLDDPRWTRAGTANGNRVTVRALAYMMAGHVRHHLAVLAERYGAAAPSNGTSGVRRSP